MRTVSAHPRTNVNAVTAQTTEKEVMKGVMGDPGSSISRRTRLQERSHYQLSSLSNRGRGRRPQPCPSETMAKGASSAFADLRPDADETALLTATRTGNHSAFDILVGRYAQRIHRLTFRITRNHEDAEDAVQDCFQSAFMHFQSFRGQSRFSTWLTRIALNCALMKIRGRRREVVPLEDSIDFSLSIKYREILSSSPTPEETYARKELGSILASEIARLKPQSRKSLYLCCIRELATQDAAKLLGISNAGVKARVHRAKLALRSEFDRMGLRHCRCSKHRRMDVAVWGQDSGASAQVLATRYCSGIGD